MLWQGQMQPWTHVTDHSLPGLTWHIRLGIGISNLSISGIVVYDMCYIPRCYSIFCCCNRAIFFPSECFCFLTVAFKFLFNLSYRFSAILIPYHIMSYGFTLCYVVLLYIMLYCFMLLCDYCIFNIIVFVLLLSSFF